MDSEPHSFKPWEYQTKKHHGHLASGTGGSSDSLIFELIFTAFLFVLDIFPYWVTKVLSLAIAIGFFIVAYQLF
ncbi:hypothetical protein D1B31_13820 [Neobacillus notoginsengisoli]|uniref:Uncharacterized protein n=1 Tax=Neobacillus notoginsengisoli TaxID=1578198 RepID=A0A417YSW3_9BACI|nr:hypothetical protein [Neobacillus notoginsengisoli]RHW39036.1 hypothetical protein D1B31_13820 [Neobacillus notoginsengisoli]